jgi:hypothetical protein
VAFGGALLLQRLAAVEDRSGAGERFRGLSRRFAFGGGESVGADAESLKISVGDMRVNSIAPTRQAAQGQRLLCV